MVGGKYFKVKGLLNTPQGWPIGGGKNPSSFHSSSLLSWQAANASRHWPTGRGIFHNAEKTFLVWVGEEDHLRIISMAQGGDVGQVGERGHCILLYWTNHSIY